MILGVMACGFLFATVVHASINSIEVCGYYEWTCSGAGVSCVEVCDMVDCSGATCDDMSTVIRAQYGTDLNVCFYHEGAYVKATCDEGSDANVGLIVGIAVGAVVLVCFIITVAVICYKRKKSL